MRRVVLKVTKVTNERGEGKGLNFGHFYELSRISAVSRIFACTGSSELLSVRCGLPTVVWQARVTIGDYALAILRG